jgi:hypothetical protein
VFTNGAQARLRVGRARHGPGHVEAGASAVKDCSGRDQ